MIVQGAGGRARTIGPDISVTMKITNAVIYKLYEYIYWRRGQPLYFDISIKPATHRLDGGRILIMIILMKYVD